MFLVFLIADRQGKEVDIILSTMTVTEFDHWRHYYSINPPEGQRIDIAAGIISSRFAGGKPIEHMPQFVEEPKQKLSRQELSDKIKNYFSKGIQNR